MKNILEIACGTGRILLSLQAPGRCLTGADLSADMLNIAQEKSVKQSIPAEWIQADMCDLPDLGQFDLIICGFNALQHVLCNDRVLDCLNGVKRNLAPGGTFILDVYLPHLSLIPTMEVSGTLLTFQDESGAEIRIDAYSLFHPETLIHDITFRYYRNGDYLCSEPYQMMEYLPENLKALFLLSGLTIISSYGGYDLSPLQADSKKQIYLMRAT